jgi:hypothetical protein
VTKRLVTFEQFYAASARRACGTSRMGDAALVAKYDAQVLAETLAVARVGGAS